MLEISIARRFGRPQVFAGLLLLMFLAQCIWLLVRMPVAGIVDNPGLLRAVGEGTRQLHGGAIAGNGDSLHSPLWYLTLAVLVAVTGPPGGPAWFAWAVAAPQIAFGMLLGASLWYVSRRLCGNEGGYVALALYCFSPGILRSSTLWFTEPEMGAAWGAFGTVFTAIALAHTLYAPREVVLWNWRRILLLGLSFALAIGCQFSLAVLIVAALGLLLYLAWERRAAALAIWLAACGIALLLISASYFFRNDAFRQSLRGAFFFGLRWRPYISSLAYGAFISRLEEISPALLITLPAALICYVLWPRTRYFGNTAPLLIACLLIFFSIGTPHLDGFGFSLIATPFLFVFTAGIAADLLETRHRRMVAVCVWGLLLAQMVANLRGLLLAGLHSFQ